jgi:hypothetical protein
MYTCGSSQPYVGLARTIYIRCIHGVFGREITKYTVIYGVYIRFWPTLTICLTLTVLSRDRLARRYPSALQARSVSANQQGQIFGTAQSDFSMAIFSVTTTTHKHTLTHIHTLTHSHTCMHTHRHKHTRRHIHSRTHARTYTPTKCTSVCSSYM